MSIKNNKKLTLSGILLVVSTVCYALYQILLSTYIEGFYGISDYPIAWNNIIFTVICAVALVSYCFVFSRTKLNHIVYYISFGMFALLNTYFCITNISDGHFDLYTLSDTLFFAITVIMLIVKVKSSKGVSVAGMVIFGAYAVVQILAVISDLVSGFHIGGFIWLIFDAYLVIEFIAFFNIWLAEGGSITTKKKAPTVVKTPLENNLVSLKQLYESGAITEQEYNQKKTEILNIL